MLHEIDPIVFSMQILAIGQCQDLDDQNLVISPYLPSPAIPSLRADSRVYPK